MTTINNISIPQTCHQPWQQMSASGNGRHCEHCCKTVVDFTKMTNDEIIGYLATKNNVCGRFNQQQLSNLNQHGNLPVSGRWKRWVMAAGLFASTLFYRTSAQVKPATPQTIDQSSTCRPADGFVLGKIAAYRVIKGHVTDANNIGLADAIIKAGALTAVTDANGNFQLRLPFSTKQFVVSRIGYTSRTVTIDTATEYPVKLANVAILMGEVVVAPRKTPVMNKSAHK